MVRLRPGDSLVFRSGRYAISSKLVIQNISGTPQHPITIRAEQAGQAVFDAKNNYDLNVLEIYNSRYLVVDGFEIIGGDDGIDLRQTNDHLVLENLHIHYTGNVGIGAQGADDLTTYLTVRHCEIDHTGLGGGTGEGMYLGHHASRKPNVHHALIENNYIHHTKGGSQGDGIEIKHMSFANIVQDNVLHDVGPGITVYVTGRNNPADVNIIRRNVIWNTDDFGIWSAGESMIENNILFHIRDGSGIQIAQNAELNEYGVRDLTIRNNTVVDVCCGSSNPAIRIEHADRNVVVANNVFYQNDASEVAIRLDLPLSSIDQWKRNYFYGELVGLDADDETIRGRPPASEFTNPVAEVGRIDLYPLSGSSFLLRADPSQLPYDDYNGTLRQRGGTGTAGAYEFGGPHNPAKPLSPGFKR